MCRSESDPLPPLDDEARLRLAVCDEVEALYADDPDVTVGEVIYATIAVMRRVSDAPH